MGPLARRTRRLGVVVGIIAVVVAGATVLSRSPAPATTTTTRPHPTTTTVPPERAQAFWSVVSHSARGVMVDYRNVVAGGVTFRALRLRARTTFLRWHVGSGDPLRWASVPADAGPSIDWPVEGPAGVVAVFNGAFKQVAGAGGSMVDGLVLAPLVRGDATIALDAYGHWAIGTWGSPAFAPRGFVATTVRQNLVLLVANARPTPAALHAPWKFWGDPLHEVPGEPRSGLGVDAAGNLIYVATMGHVLAPDLARAMVAAGVVTGMELDINPFWPILGASFVPLHHPSGYSVQLPLAQHDPTIYNTGWERDFFVALAEPNRWGCDWRAPGLRARLGTAQPQRPRRVGPGC